MFLIITSKTLRYQNNVALLTFMNAYIQAENTLKLPRYSSNCAPQTTCNLVGSSASVKAYAWCGIQGLFYLQVLRSSSPPFTSTTRGEYPPVFLKIFKKLPPCIIWLTKIFQKITALHYCNITIKYIRICTKITTSAHPLTTLCPPSDHPLEKILVEKYLTKQIGFLILAEQSILEVREKRVQAQLSVFYTRRSFTIY